MAFCSYSSKLVTDGYMVIDNAFFNEFLPAATGDDVKVYLYGLFLCSSPESDTNSLESISNILSLSKDQVQKSFEYWNEIGLVQIASRDPFEVKFLPVRAVSGSLKIRDKEKYTDFNADLSAILTRQILPTEFDQYYTLIEKYHFEPEALLLIVKYCTTLKGGNIGYPYILAVARDFNNQGIRTFEAVEGKFLEQEQNSNEIKEILKALGVKREADLDERNMYLKWTNTFGFTHGVIVDVAKSLKKKGGFDKLDETLTKYFEQKLFSIQDIAKFAEQKEYMLQIAKSVIKNLGDFYRDYDPVITNYVMDWVNKGYDKETLDQISNYCFRQNIKSLNGMNEVVQKFFKQGLVSLEAIKNYISSILEENGKIKEILAVIVPFRTIRNSDRNLYKIWTRDWGFCHEALLEVANFSKDKSDPVPYMNKILSTLHESGNTSLEAVKKNLASQASTQTKTTAKPKDDIYRHDYTKEELDAVFDSLDDVEI